MSLFQQNSRLIAPHQKRILIDELPTAQRPGSSFPDDVEAPSWNAPTPPWTRVTEVYARRQLVIRLVFGAPKRIDWPDSGYSGGSGSSGGGVTRYWFEPGRLFAVLWWARLSPRRQVAGFAVAEGLRAGERGHLIPGVAPAVRVHAFLLTRCVGRDRRVVHRAEELIRRIERQGIEAELVPAGYYRAAGQSLRVGREPRRLERDGLLRYLRSTSHAD